MDKFKRIDTKLEGVILIEPLLYGDHRGFFLETYNKAFFEKLGIDDNFIQDNHSKSKKGVLRGLHFQTKHSQGKLIRVIKGAIYDVVVDIRKNSKTYGKWYGVILSEKNRKMLFIKPGFAHGFLTLEEDTEILYKCTDRYAPKYESGIAYDDKDLNIDWKLEKYGIKEVILSEKDKNHKSFKEYSKIYQGENVLLLGANGQLGSDFQKLFDKNGVKYIATDRDIIDITNKNIVKKYIHQHNIDIVINCAAYNQVDSAEKEKEECLAINTQAVKDIAEICKEKGIIFVTYSTDFVFDGNKNMPYTENDIPNPLSYYSYAKLLGENEALKYSKSIVIRTSWLFGIGNDNFCTQVIKWSKENTLLKIVDDQVSSPTYSKDLANYSWELIQNDLYGLFHFSNDGEISKYEQAKYLLSKTGWKGELKRAKSCDFNLSAKRPNYSKLDSGKIRRLLKKEIPHWKDAINRFLLELNKQELK